MATNFPTSVDSFTNPTAVDTLDSPPHDQQHADVNDAVEAIETALLDGAPLHIDDVNERVGIGTATPDFQFQVESGNEYVAISPTDNDAIRLASDTAAGRPFISFYNQDDVGSLVRKGYIGYPTNAQTTANSRFTINAGDGDSDLFIDAAAVGIGDNTPSYKLDVNGDINATGNVRVGGTAIGERQSYTPTILAGGSVGNGTITGEYVLIQKFVMFYVKFTLGSTSTITGDLQISVPPGLNFGPNDVTSATAMYTDLSTSAQFLGAVRPYGLSLYCRVVTDDYGAGGVYVTPNTFLSSTVPFTWSTGDIMAASGITVLA
jgi:hypothetical protein